MYRVSRSPYIWMLYGSLSFALMATFVHALGSSCPWQLIALARTFLALVIASVLALSAGVRFVLWKPRTLWIRSIAGSLSLVGTFFAFTRLPVADVLTLTSMFPIWVALLSWPMLHEPPSMSVWIAVGTSALGVVLIQQPHAGQANFAAFIAVASSFSTAVAMIGLHRLQEIDVRAIVVHFSGVSLVFCILAFILFERDSDLALIPDPRSTILLLGVGITATIGQILLTKAYATGVPAKVSVVCLSQIVFAMMLDVLLWHRTFNTPSLIGIGLVVIPTAWVMTRKAEPLAEDDGAQNDAKLQAEPIEIKQ